MKDLIMSEKERQLRLWEMQINANAEWLHKKMNEEVRLRRAMDRNLWLHLFFMWLCGACFGAGIMMQYM